MTLLFKTREERLGEVLEIRRKFNTLQLSPEIEELFDILNNFVNNGEYKLGCIKGDIIQKNIIYHLKVKRNRTSEVILRHLK